MSKKDSEEYLNHFMQCIVRQQVIQNGRSLRYCIAILQSTFNISHDKAFELVMNTEIG